MGIGERRPDNDGFAAAYLDGLQLSRRPKARTLLEGDAYPGIDKEAPRQRAVVAKEISGIIFGRQLNLAHRNNGWLRFIDTAAKSSGPAIEGLTSTELYVPYLSVKDHDTLMRAYVTRHDNPRKTQKDLTRELQGSVKIIQGYLRSQTDAEGHSFNDLHSAGWGVDTDRARKDKDYIKSFEEQGYGIWQPAIFTASSSRITESAGIISVGLLDPDNQLSSARNNAVDRLCGAMGVDANMLVDEWVPEIRVLRSTARRALTTRLRLPAMPIDVPLRPPSINIAS